MTYRNIDPFGDLVASKKVNKNVYANKYMNGTINIDGQKFVGYSMTEAIKIWRGRNKR